MTTPGETVDLDSFIDATATASVAQVESSTEAPPTLGVLTKLVAQVASNVDTLTKRMDALVERS